MKGTYKLLLGLAATLCGCSANVDGCAIKNEPPESPLVERADKADENEASEAESTQNEPSQRPDAKQAPDADETTPAAATSDAPASGSHAETSQASAASSPLDLAVDERTLDRLQADLAKAEKKRERGKYDDAYVEAAKIASFVRQYELDRQGRDGAGTDAAEFRRLLDAALETAERCAAQISDKSPTPNGTEPISVEF